VDFARSSNDMQFCYVNGRMVRDKLINHAIRLAFEDKIYPGRFPAYVLHLTCDLDLVDVNVHPTKHEVRFREARTVHDFVLSSLQKVMSPIVMAPSKSTPVVGTQHAAPKCSTHELNRISPTVLPIFGHILTVLDKRIVIVQQDTMIRAINWVKTINNYIFSQWDYFLEQSNKPLVPLLSPINIIHENVDNFTQALSKIGIASQIIGPNHLIMRDLPRFLQGLPEETINPFVLNQPSEFIRRDIALAWAQSQSLNHREIERLLDSIHALSPDLISSKDYVPEMFI
jgi:DNA mismatch repair protein MutL